MTDVPLTIADDSPLSDDAVRALAVLLVDLAEAADQEEKDAPPSGRPDEA